MSTFCMSLSYLEASSSTRTYSKEEHLCRQPEVSLWTPMGGDVIITGHLVKNNSFELILFRPRFTFTLSSGG